MSRPLLVLLLAACSTAADGDAGPPTGFVKIESIGRIHLFAPSKDLLQGKARSNLLVEVRRMYDTFVTKYGLDKEVFRIGQDGGLYADTRREVVVLCLFPDQASYDEWCGRGGTAGVTHHLARYAAMVSAPLKDGELLPETIATLWHEFSHVFYSHYLMMGAPMWLNEGLGEYFACSEKHGKGLNTDNYRLMVENLATRHREGSSTDVRDLLLAQGEDFGRQQYDEAWVLVHLLMTEAPDTLNQLLGALSQLDATAWANAEAVLEDMHQYGTHLVTEAVGGEEALQKAWDAHLEAIIADPIKPKKGAARIAGLRPEPWCTLTARMSGGRDILDEDGYTIRARRPIGSAKYTGPWPAVLRVLAAQGDGKGAWSKEYIVADETSVRRGSVIEFKELYMPDYDGTRLGRVTGEWVTEAGGVYRVRKVWNFK